MKIAVVNQPMDMLIPPDQNSIGIWTYKTAPFVARRHDVLVLGKRSQAQRSWPNQGGVRYEFVPPRVPNRKAMKVMDVLLGRLKRRRLPSYASRLVYLDYAVQTAIAARRHGSDVVHIHNFSQFVPTVRRICPKARIVLHMSCEWLDQLDYKVVDRRLHQTDLVIGCSDYITERVVKRFPHHASRCVTVYNGVDIEQFAPPTRSERPVHGPRRVLFVGRVSPEKGLHDMIDAFALVAVELPDVQLDIAGPFGALPREFLVDVSDDDEVRDLAKFYTVADGTDYADTLHASVPGAISDRVRFLGGLPQAELRDAYVAADVLVNPSYSESFGMSLVEALACGTPVIATRVGGMTAIVGDDESVGLLVDRGNVRSLADAIIKILTDADFQAVAGQRGRARALERFSWQRVADSLTTEFERLGTPRGRESPLRARVADRLGDRISKGCDELSESELRRSALVVAPHYDDETLGCGGTIARKVRLGAVVHVVFMSDGVASHGDHIDRVSLGQIRRLEAIAALKALGVDPETTEYAGLPDGDLSGHHARSVEMLADLLRKFRPEQVFVPHRGDGHADHVVTTAAAFAAARHGLEHVDVYEYPVWHWQQWPWVGLASPLCRRGWKAAELNGDAWRRSVRGRFGFRFPSSIDCFVDVTETVAEKRAALDAYESQIRRPDGRPDWPILEDVSRGQFLARLTHEREFFRITRVVPRQRA